MRSPARRTLDAGENLPTLGQTQRELSCRSCLGTTRVMGDNKGVSTMCQTHTTVITW